ncbi:MAG: amino acid transporter, partial [SAR116 cluster bacterium]|nr:amino acid transporter [SAR116 cluster bacterium]
MNLYARCLVRFLLTLAAGYFALTIPHFGLFLSLIGCVTCNLLAFILPAYFHYYVTILEPSKYRNPKYTQ